MSANPYRQRQDPSTPLLGERIVTVEAVQVDGVQAAKATQVRSQLSKFGRTVFLRKSIYVKTNHYIEQSRPYIPQRRLRTYFYIRFMRWVFLIYCVLCIPMPFVPNFMWPWSAVTGGIGLIWLMIFAQHMHVVYWTIPQVLSQPILSDVVQPRENDFYVYTRERVEEVFLSAWDSGIGIVQSASGSASASIKFQALNETAARTVRASSCLSCCMLLVTILVITLSAIVFAARFSAALAEEGTQAPYLNANTMQ